MIVLDLVVDKLLGRLPDFVLVGLECLEHFFNTVEIHSLITCIFSLVKFADIFLMFIINTAALLCIFFGTRMIIRKQYRIHEI